MKLWPTDKLLEVDILPFPLCLWLPATTKPHVTPQMLRDHLLNLLVLQHLICLTVFGCCLLSPHSNLTIQYPITPEPHQGNNQVHDEKHAARIVLVPHSTDGEVEAKFVQLSRKGILNLVNINRQMKAGFSNRAGKLRQASPELNEPSHSLKILFLTPHLPNNPMWLSRPH